MVREERFQYQMKNIAEAKTFLIARAAKRVFLRAGSSEAERLREILRREFVAEHIKFQPRPPQGQSAAISTRLDPETEDEYLCFGNLLVRAKFGQPVTEADCQQLREVLQKQGWPTGMIVSFSPTGVQVRRVDL